MTISLVALLWAHPGKEAALEAYETAVLALVPEHGGRVLQRARGDGSSGQPIEVQVFEFADQAGLDAYMEDPRRIALSRDRDAAVARTEVVPVRLV